MYIRAREELGRVPRSVRSGERQTITPQIGGRWLTEMNPLQTQQRVIGSRQDALSGTGIGRLRVPRFLRLIPRLARRLVPRLVPPLLPRLIPDSPLVWSLFKSVVLSNVAMAKQIAIPQDYKDKLLAYARYNRRDGAVLLAGFTRRPRYFKGGWIMKLQPGAGAMTLDTAVFVKGKLNIGTYVHEMVHVGQYKKLGIAGFLASYFGLSGLTILQRWIRRKPTNPMRSSPHEEQAYRIEARFCDWLKKQMGLDCHQ